MTLLRWLLAGAIGLCFVGTLSGLAVWAVWTILEAIEMKREHDRFWGQE